MTLLNNAKDHDVTTLVIDLNGHNPNEFIAVEGRYLFYLQGTADIKIRFNSPSADEIMIPKGADIRLPNGFDQIYISSSGTDKITLLIFGDDNAKVTLPPPTAGNSNNLDSNHNYTVTTTESIIWPAISTLKEGIIFNNSNSETIYVGSTGVTSATGLPIPPKNSVSLTSLTGNLYAVTSANTAEVRMMRVL